MESEKYEITSSDMPLDPVNSPPAGAGSTEFEGTHLISMKPETVPSSPLLTLLDTSIIGHDIDTIIDKGIANPKTNNDGKTDDERTKSRSDAKGRAGNVGKTDRRYEKTDGGEASAAPKRKCDGAGAKSKDLADTNNKGQGTNGNSSPASKLRIELAVLESVLEA